MSDLQAAAQTKQQQLLTTEQIEQVIYRLRQTLQNNPLWQAQLKNCIEEIILQSAYERWLQTVGDNLWTKANIGVADVTVPIADFYALFVNGTEPEQAATAVLQEVCCEQS
ncbi:hypothetical protein [Candidatus Leptofilum sp.]|uniref:hypothetical protein n=1 Tax=Candidatus Leptofilum sp. TaxID=3241576 RepID=UPI003B5B4067